MYAEGRGGFSKNLARSAELYREASDQGDRDATFNLAALLELGSAAVGSKKDARYDPGVERNECEAARLYRVAADMGDPGAQLNLGLM